MHIHILGICGTFMGGLAALARAAGHQVTGCDVGVYPPMSDQLRALGIELIEGYGADQLGLNPDCWVVGNVVSRAMLADGSPRYPLMEAILDQGLRYTSGPQWLSEQVLQGRQVLAVAGTHGKTTTSTMLAWILECAALNPSFLIGGVPLNFGVSARLTQSPYFVIEADEYDTAFFDKRSKFVHYRPRIAILNNLEFDHADIFPDLAAIERQFHHLVRTVPQSGSLVVNHDAAALQSVLAQGCWSRMSTFGSQDADWQYRGEATRFQVMQAGRVVGTVNWALTGQHNQLNALAAIAAAAQIGVSPALAVEALARFESVKRRMEVRGVVTRKSAALHSPQDLRAQAPTSGSPEDAITIYDDFAHHPTAIATTLEGLRRQLNSRQQSAQRILAVFEPRSNTMKLGNMKAQLPQALKEAALAFCYTGGLEWDAAQALSSLGQRAIACSDLDQLVQRITQCAQPGDHIVCMSNGGFGGIHDKLMQALGATATAQSQQQA